MAYIIKDFDFIATESETMNIVLTELQRTLRDFKIAVNDISERLDALENKEV